MEIIYFLLVVLLISVIFFWPLLVRLICNKLLSRLPFFRFRMTLEHVIVCYLVYVILYLFVITGCWAVVFDYLSFQNRLRINSMIAFTIVYPVFIKNNIHWKMASNNFHIIFSSVYPRHRAGDFAVILPLVRFLWPPELRLGYPFHHLENVYLF